MASSHYSLPAGVSTGFQLLSVLLLWLLVFARVHAQNRRDEVRALLSFKEDNQSGYLDYGYWFTWRATDENPCAWVGVICTANSTVLELDLSGWNWQTVSFDLGALSNLRDLRLLDLSSNGMYGTPTVIGNLTGLTLLNLSSNSLEAFPDFGNLTGLTLLDLSQTGLKGEIPPGISACSGLRFLSLQDNLLDGGISNLRGLGKLQILLLANNNFSGPFPQQLGELTRLVTLDLSNNSFVGSIPTLPELSRLVYLTLDSNNFTEFEADWFLGENSTLGQVSVSFNQLTGTIPLSLANLTELAVLNLSANRLSGSIPFGFSHSLDNALVLDLSQNQLSGKLPADMLQQNTTYCASLNLSGNHITGSIPPIKGDIDYSCFIYIDFSHNNLSGSLPKSIFGDDHYQVDIDDLWLQNNQLSGDIVDVMLQSPILYTTYEVHLEDNLFTGDLSRMANMSLAQGQYSGDQFLDVLDLRNNDLRWRASELVPDPIQATLERLSIVGPFMTGFLAGGNDFSGTSLPKTCFLNNSESGVGLQLLDLSNSQLNGEILSAAFNSSCLQFLETLNLSNNHITGSVPESIVTIPSLAVLDVSNNRLSGRFPPVSLNSTLINPNFYLGNDALCGYPLSHSCPMPSVHWWVFLLAIGGPLTIALISCSAATWRWRVYHRQHQQDADLIRTLMERDSATLMSLRDLRKATDNFADSAQIGQGGFGTVYKGKLNDGTIVAIKRSKREGSEKSKEQFLNEVRILSQVTHRNLVKLMGCCMENKIAVLVFEFVSNGTLQEHLRGKIQGAICLTWKERLNIAVQTADALNYLHSAATFPIYHRDVKSANILLNDDLNAKVADFGISRLAPVQEATHVSTEAVQGTMGYIDPEYYTSYQLTDRSDVYSFGVVLLELISAKPALDFRRDEEETSLVNFAGPYIERGDLEGFLDPALTETYTDLAGHGRESILNVGKLAMACVAMRSKSRPNMNEVLKELQSLSFEFNGSASSRNVKDSGIKKDDDDDDDDEDEARPDNLLLLPESFGGDSSTLAMDSTDASTSASSIQLTQFSSPRARPPSFTSISSSSAR